jgi:membrane protein implicated in regulation of membrane protease activity
MGNDPTILGCTGTIIVPTRGTDGPGEVLVKVRGGTEAYLAWSERPLPKGTQVVVFEFRGERTVDVMEFGNELDA